MGTDKKFKLHIVTEFKIITHGLITNMRTNKMEWVLLASTALHVFMVLVSGDSAICQGKYECPKYKVIKKTEYFEIRHYPIYKYAVARQVGGSMWWSNSMNFRKLFRYIDGVNEEREKISMTVPVICPIKKDRTGKFVKDFSMWFWLPEKYQCDDCTPKPMKQDDATKQVQIVKWGNQTVYVHQYSWFTYQSRIKNKAEMLKRYLKATDIRDYDDSVVYSATYNGPWKFWNRRNEVMFIQRKNNEGEKRMSKQKDEEERRQSKNTGKEEQREQADEQNEEEEE